ncbi:hypothetical protein ACPPVO_26035 [Dactylosporangium sp. McL0621]|uniref:hypothetical protein n=1 Tax=Dactylosporangium sp. McL0621 TaxID=3415678 RepID=UPI003CF16D13
MSDLSLESTNQAYNGTEIVGHSAYESFTNDFVLKINDVGGSADGIHVFAPGGSNRGGDAIRAEGLNHGVLGIGNLGVEGRGEFDPGVLGTSSRSDGVLGRGALNGVAGYTSNSGASGVYGDNAGGGRGGPGVAGHSNNGNGVQGVSAGGYGVYGESGSVHGVVGKSNGNYGVWGNGAAGGVFAGTNIGILASGPIAGSFRGDVKVSGTLTKGALAFRIDHPLDPDNKYLNHSGVESTDMKNIYDGLVELDERGEATVLLPEWCEALNTDFRYQLTCIGRHAPVYIAAKMRDNRFRIGGGEPGLEVSWQLTGVRQDPFARANRIVVEEEKPAGDRGRFVHPEVHGRPDHLCVADLADRVAELWVPDDGTALK